MSIISQVELRKLRDSFVITNVDNLWGKREKASHDMQGRIDEARLKELGLKHWSRIGLSLFSAILLSWQNFQVFDVVNRAFQNGQLVNLQPIFTALIAATLTETYFIMRVIVTYVFSSNDYTYEKN
ncbi:hypothetical protein KJ980_02215 [Patescibacteria group bacterium]|nr:hypothetical protein [Patescibacteria group bacterium]MBU4098445.1 hypothetical protein [Patescibacteria group bacterium]